ncbi:MAG: hypothetical protein HKN35_05620 [Woeseia sp.]|nr:hypothetical protein [Woeseia sp.]MBT8095669.1 hypothetical protein [Woeseia sp.]NNE60348.1 hypothetical protein [Woeseia sp.]NNL54653.1 hypothetical protein [Woeseia sp.]
MNYSQNRPQIPTGNPLANALVIVVGIVLIGLSLVLGVVAFIAIGSVVLVMASIVGIRVWWLQRRLRKAAGKGERKAQPRDASVEIIEGEYRIISRETDDR